MIKKILSAMGESPSAFLMDFRVKRHGRLFSLKYRFNETDDIVCLLFIVHELLRKYSSLENVFERHYSLNDTVTGSGIAGFINEALSIDTSPIYGRNIHPPGLTQFFPSPIKGSACKRMNLFLRWMVRDRDIDFGIWKWMPKNKLIIPLDTHIAKISRCLGFTRRASSDWKTAVEITEALKVFDPEDPLKYDFALCHQGISRLCRGSKDRAGCRGCVFTIGNCF
ncbi:MAG: TIGR02757 family protein [Thermodesulfovibrionales bacterium]